MILLAGIYYPEGYNLTALDEKTDICDNHVGETMPVGYSRSRIPVISACLKRKDNGHDSS